MVILAILLIWLCIAIVVSPIIGHYLKDKS